MSAKTISIRMRNSIIWVAPNALDADQGIGLLTHGRGVTAMPDSGAITSAKWRGLEEDPSAAQSYRIVQEIRPD